MVAAVAPHAGAASECQLPAQPGGRLKGFTDADLRAYKRRFPALFPGEPAPASPGAGSPWPDSNGYPSEAAFQADAAAQLTLLGWDVQESLKGSHGGGPVWYTPGWPDLVLYRAPRRIWFAELKQPGRQPSDDQLACHARLRAAGFRVIVAYDLQTLLDVEREERPHV